MISLDFICQYPQVVSEALRKRRDARNVDDILRLAEQRRGLATRTDGLFTSLKKLKETVRTAPAAKRPALNQQIKAVTEDIRKLEIQSGDVDTRLQLLLLSLPNLPHKGVQEGDSEAYNRELRKWGEPLEFQFEPQAHWDLGERLGIIDAESGGKIAGSRFVTLKGAGARLERALIAFMLDIHTQERGYTEIMPPLLAKRSVMLGAGQLPKFEDQAYVSYPDELYLNPTAEVPLVGMHSDTIFPTGTLPLRYVAWTTAFRREAGSASRQTRGLLRLHQFNKVELFQIVAPEDSYAALEQMLLDAETVLQRLDLPYRAMGLCTANLPFASAMTIDLEVWMPGQGRYVEVSSVSNCEAFQARRANIKYRPVKSTRAEYVHTLNASGLAVGRTMAAILETYQQADGSVVVPKVLRPYMGISQLSPQYN
ncbi:MAG: serine--tRNA ligase [Chloroflexi bacterium]|nr:serine--tRNA ligase [Chloroflexota bacterium]